MVILHWDFEKRNVSSFGFRVSGFGFRVSGFGLPRFSSIGWQRSPWGPNAKLETRNSKLGTSGFLLAGLLRFCRKEPGYFASPEFSILTRRQPVVSHVTNADPAEFDN